MRSQSDERLVALARAGDERAFVAIVERYRHELLRQARRLDSGGRAEDIVQQTFLSAFAALHAGAEVAESMGLTEGAVRQLVHRARATLRTAATALTPLPFAKLFWVARGIANTDGTSGVAIGAGTGSAGGAMERTKLDPIFRRPGRPERR